MRIGAQVIRSQNLLLSQLASKSLASLSNSGKSGQSKSLFSSFERSTISTSRQTGLGTSQLRTSAAAQSRSAARSAIKGVRQELFSMRDLLRQDKDQALSSSARLSNQSKIDSALQRINDLAQLVTPSTDSQAGPATGVQFSALNDKQLDSLQIDASGDLSETTFSGTVLSNAKQASVTYQGVNGAVTTSASFQVAGSAGQATIEISEGESLAAVAERINQQTTVTSVIASVDGDDLVLSSVGSGSSSTTSVSLISLDKGISVSDVNSSQLSSFSVIDIDSASLEAISGTVIQAAATAELKLTGDSGRVDNSATFVLTGDLGSKSISITQGESLTDVADRINDLSASTGVVASVNGDEVSFSSLQVGSQASATVELTNIVTVAGINGAQVAGVSVDSIENGATHILTGDVSHEAEQAELKVQGDNGTVKADGTFNLAGNLGSVQFSAQQGEVSAHF